MLEEITITGLGVIESATARFPAGLSVVTGETGAGKTMVVTGLHMLSGGRVDAGRVRSGAESAVVEGRFSEVDGPDTTDVLEATGAAVDDDGSVIAIRSLTASGRSRAHLGGRAVPLSSLGGFTLALLTIHGQNDQLRLAKPDQQRAALDTFAGEALAKLVTSYQGLRDDWIAARDLLHDRSTRSRELAQEADRLRFALEEIDAVDPEPGEDAAITAQIARLSDLEAIRDSAQAVAGLLGTDDGGAAAALGAARTQAEQSPDAAVNDLVTRIVGALTEVTDIAAEAGAILADLPTDPAALEQLLHRQQALKALFRKYAPDADGVIEFAAQARATVADIDSGDLSVAELTEREAATRAAAVAAAGRLTKARRKAAEKLAAAVSRELSGLAMGDASLQVAVTTDGDLGRYGSDHVEFLLAAHPGAEPRPIAKSASGGELSRLMLALEVVLASKADGLTMVFDEVDAGVGGRAAVEIGKRLAALAKSHQVIVVTHLPQVAAFADAHLVVGKRTREGAVTSTVDEVADADRVAELARMLAGLGDTDTGRAHAEELLAAAAPHRSGRL